VAAARAGGSFGAWKAALADTASIPAVAS
jgi:hypothetical protein